MSPYGESHNDGSELMTPSLHLPGPMRRSSSLAALATVSLRCRVRDQCASWVLTILALLSRGGLAESALCPYSAFEAMSPSDLRTLEVKCTWVGDQDYMIHTLAFTSDQNLQAFSMADFVPYRRPDLNYGNDDDSASVRLFSVPVQLLAAFVHRVGTLPGAVDGDVDSLGNISFMLVNAAGPSGPCGFESVLRQGTNGRALFTEMRVALGANAPARKIINEWGCMLNLLPNSAATNATSSVEITLGEVRADDATGLLITMATVCNTSGRTLAAPLSLAPNPRGQVELSKPDG